MTVVFSSFAWDILRHIEQKLKAIDWAASYERNITRALKLLQKSDMKRNVVLDIPWTWNEGHNKVQYVVHNHSLQSRLLSAARSTSVATLQSFKLVKRPVLHQNTIESLQIWQTIVQTVARLKD